MSRCILANLFCLLGAALSAQAPVAKLAAGFGEDCFLFRESREAEVCMAPRLLYPGDELEKTAGIASLRIQWFAPPATYGVRKGRTRLRVAFRVPKDPSRLVALAKRAYPAASRAAMEALVELRAPDSPQEKVVALSSHGVLALLPGRKIQFSAGEGPGRLQVRDEQGALVFERAFQAAGLALLPEEMGLLPEVIYVWTLSGQTPQQGRMRLVDRVMAGRIEADLGSMGADPVAAAYYLQMLWQPSGDFGWLSRQMLARSGSALAGELRKASR